MVNNCTKNYRHEYKYICSGYDIELVHNSIDTIATPDKHVIDGKYLIRSIYFDDYYDTAYYDNESGVDPRKKWRIRAYNCDDTHIFLECKEKCRGMIYKRQTRISKEQFNAILCDSFDVDNDNADALLTEFFIEARTKLLHPVVIVQYIRYPYVYPEGNVRITLDCNISSAIDFDRFFDSNLPVRAIQETYQQLIEVKYDDMYPDTLCKLLNLEGMVQTAFSKYYLCRKIH